MPSVIIQFDGTPASAESAEHNMKPTMKKGKKMSPAKEAAMMRKMKAMKKDEKAEGEDK